MYESIVVGTDGSKTAGIAVQRAIELAKASGAKLHIVNAFQSASVASSVLSAEGVGMSVDVQSINAAAGESSQQIAANAVAHAKSMGVDAEVHSISGSAADALMDAARVTDADLIVVGNRGMSGAKRFVLGSVPNKVSHHAPCDVLIVSTQDG